MKKYWQIFRLQIQETLEYKWSVLLFRLSSLLSLFTIIAIWFASKTERVDFGGFSMSELITYYVGAMAISGFVYWFPTGIMKEEIADGSINSKALLKPISYYWQKFFAEFGWHMISPIFSIISVAVVIIFLGTNLTLDINFTYLLLLVVSVVLAAFICFNFSYCLGLVAFWFTEVSEISSMMWMGLYIFGGQSVPISFFPESVRWLINLLPFRYMFSFPLEILSNKLEITEILIGLFVQIIWVIIFVFVSKFMWNNGIKRYSAFGG